MVVHGALAEAVVDLALTRQRDPHHPVMATMDASAECLADCRVRRSRIHGFGLFTNRAIDRRRKLGELSGIVRRRPLARQEHQRREVMQLVECSRRWALEVIASLASKA